MVHVEPSPTPLPGQWARRARRPLRGPPGDRHERCFGSDSYSSGAQQPHRVIKSNLWKGRGVQRPSSTPPPAAGPGMRPGALASALDPGLSLEPGMLGSLAIDTRIDR